MLPSVFVLASFGGFAAPALAQGRGVDLASPERPDDGFALDLGVDLTLPLAVGGRMQLEMPGRVLGRFVLGALPDALGSAFADAAGSLGGWDEGTHRTVSDALGGALYLEAAIGVRPFESAGLELGVGYVLIWTQATLSLSGLGGRLETSNHALHATLGYRALAFDMVFFRIEAGWLHTLGAMARVDLEQPSYEPADLEGQIESQLVARGMGPTLSLSAGVHLP